MTPTTHPNTPTQAPAPITLTAIPIATTPDISGSSAGNSGTAGDNSYQVTLQVTLEPEDWIYHDYITLSCDSLDISLSPWQATQEPVARYINNFKETKLIYANSFSITSIATIPGKKTNDSGQAMGANLGAGLASQTHATLGNLHLTYYKKSDKKITHHLIPLILSEREEENSQGKTALTRHSFSEDEGGDIGANGDSPAEPLDNTGSSQSSLTPESQIEHNTQTPPDTHEQENHAQENRTQENFLPEATQGPEHESPTRVHFTQNTDTTQAGHTNHEIDAPSNNTSTQETTHVSESRQYTPATHYIKHYTTEYRAEIHSFVIIALIVIFSLLKQKRRLACAAQNIALFILLWCYYAMADREIPSYCYWLLTAILALCVGILSIKKAEDMSPARFSKRVYRYLYYFLVIAGMITVASSLILCAKAAQAYYIISVAF